MAELDSHPIQLRVDDDLARSRLTVFFRLLLTIPHFIWLALWGIAVVFAVIGNWVVTLFRGTPPAGLHRFLSSYTRYAVHVGAYFYLAANPFPGFTGAPGYPVDVEIAEPERQDRWKTGFRLLLAIPAFLVVGAIGSGSGSASFGGASYGFSGGLAAVVALLAWFACLARARMPRGFRNAIAYSVGYTAQVYGYVLLLTDRYPNSDPASFPVVEDPGPRPIRLRTTDDLARSRLTVFFRLLLAIPHFVWLTLWGIVALLTALVNGIAAVFMGRAPSALHRFLAAFIRYQIHVYSYVSLMANPFPGFTGRPGSYPVEVEIDYAEHQNRWITFFRLFLSFPALLIAGALSGALFVAAFLGWFASLARGRMPVGLRNLGTYALRYSAELGGYFNVLTDRYPYTGPTLHGAAPSAPPTSTPAPSEG
jgi:uncharacterized protein DUF4389